MKILSFLMRSHPSIKFALVGGSGFLVDLSTLLFFHEFIQLDLLVSRVLAFIAAVTSNWFLNRIFTFSHIPKSAKKAHEWLRFFISALLAAIPNIGIFYFLMQFLPESRGMIVFAMSCGILAGYYSNYRLATAWVFNLEKSKN